MELNPPLTPAEKACKPLRVCVTGAGGYVAGHIVQRLLVAGHTVHGTVRDPQNSKVVGHLTSLPGAEQRLKLFKADLTQEQAFESAIQGCDVVIHTASPYAFDVPAGKEEELMIAPAIFGTTNVLDSVNRTPSVKRVVVTSSTVAVWGDPRERGKDHVFSEADWDLIAHPKKYPYFYSKTAAEKKAYEMHEAAAGRWSLCSINPGAIWGPPLGSRKDGESISQITDLMSGALFPWAPPLGTAVVDVRDVAQAHCVAAVNPSASGRYLLCAESTYLMPAAAKILRKVYRNRWIPPLKPPKAPLLIIGPFMGLPRPVTHATFRKLPKVDSSKAARELGLTQYIPFKTTVLDMADDMLQKDMIPKFVMPKVVPIAATALCMWVLLLWGLTKAVGLLL